MPMERPPASDREFLDRLYEAFGEATSQNEQVLRESLSDEGIDPDDLVRRGLHLVRELSRQQRLVAARTRLDRVREVVKGVARSGERFTGDVRRAIASALAGEGEGALAQAYFRKLESVEPEDLQSLVDDAKILELLERIDAESE
ncbi:MAG: hypothetical protein A2W26_11580 [Acidobacteria bacterium RBG_16_64_8]|nr:MAG: hypothetical protein A2W26_11580 [Acidobacteria bacterium RBG_16_64_8]